jgi:carboxyl-terminal processing protease
MSAAADLNFVIGHVSALYYGKVSYQALLDGERDGLQRYLAAHGIAAALPHEHAATSAEAEAAAQRQLDAALTTYGARTDGRALGYAALKGVAAAVNDRYTTYFTPAEYKDFNSGLAPERFSGVGLIIQSDPATGYIDLFDVVPDGPGDRAGLQQDDILSAIDGQSTHGMKIADASKLLRGAQHTAVHLSVLRGTQQLAVNIERENVRPATVIKHLLAQNIGYIQLSVFGENTAGEFQTALVRLQHSGARGFVIDLRDNGGGYVNAALDISSKFVNSTALVSTESRGGHFMTYYGDNEAMDPKPVAVLANANSASASEITIGALQDSGVATIVGTRTFGKGVMQDLYPLADGSAIKITVARYFTPKNHDINHIGIAPDVQVAENANPAFGIPARDAQLAAALKLIEDRLAKN